MAILLASVLLAAARAQDGPPVVPGAPDTRGANRWELNFADVRLRTNGERSTRTPLFGVRYGCGDRIDLTLECPWLRFYKEGIIAQGAREAEFGTKWRFIDSGEAGWLGSIYPQISCTRLRHLVDLGIE